MTNGGCNSRAFLNNFTSCLQKVTTVIVIHFKYLYITKVKICICTLTVAVVVSQGSLLGRDIISLSQPESCLRDQEGTEEPL